MSLEWRCEICHAKPGEPCVNTIRPGEPLPGRVEHYCRALPPDTRRRKAGA